MKLKDSVVLITGGAGNIGSYIVDEILKQEPKLCIIVDNFFNGNYTRTEKNVKLYPFDIANVEVQVEGKHNALADATAQSYAVQKAYRVLLH